MRAASASAASCAGESNGHAVTQRLPRDASVTSLAVEIV